MSFYRTSQETELRASEWEVEEKKGVQRFLSMGYTFHQDRCMNAYGIKIDL